MANRNLLPDVFRDERNLWSPLREMSRLQNRLDRIFDEVFSEPLSRLNRQNRDLSQLENQFIPPCDIEEIDNHYLLSFDLPGLKKDDVRIEVRDNILTISGERRKEHKEEKKGHVSQERYYGTFLRSFTLPTDVDPNKVEANFENGVLQIAIPRIESSKGKQIQIKEGKFLPRGKDSRPERAA